MKKRLITRLICMSMHARACKHFPRVQAREIYDGHVTSRTGGDVGWYVRVGRVKYTSHTYVLGGTAATAMM